MRDAANRRDGEICRRSKQKEIIDQQIRVNIHPVHHKSGTIGCRPRDDTCPFCCRHVRLPLAAALRKRNHASISWCPSFCSNDISLEFALALPLLIRAF
jgi:hypothetical protein